MATEKIQSRIQLKYDTLENWEKATNFVPKKGEICVYTDYELPYGESNEMLHINEPAFKVGDGETLINNLPYLGDELITEEEIRGLFSVE
jgi:hypothetical protein